MPFLGTHQHIGNIQEQVSSFFITHVPQRGLLELCLSSPYLADKAAFNKRAM